MIVPLFRIVQTDDHLIIIVKVPYVKISNAEVDVEKFKFTFYLKPYLLNLNFKQELREEEPDSGVYDHNTYEVTFKLKKKNRGEHFEDTDMINSLLSKKKKEEKKTFKIEVLGGEDFKKEEGKEAMPEEKKADIPAKLPHEIFTYGFNRNFSHFFDNLEEELLELAELDPDRSNLVERRELKLLGEEQRFDIDHYLADKFENPDIDELVLQKLALYGAAKDPADNKDVDYTNREKAMSKFSDEEWNLIVKLPKKEYLIENNQVLLVQLLDILYAFLYEYRSMTGDFTSESGWTITKLSSTLSCFTEEDSIRHGIIASIRRSLVYPLYRNFDLSLKVVEDLVNTLKTGKVLIMKAFLKVKHIFERSEPRYLLNTLYIDDFCVYLQNVDQKVFDDLAAEVEKLNIQKKDLGLDLEEIEKEALEVVDENADNPVEQAEVEYEPQIVELDPEVPADINKFDTLE